MPIKLFSFSACLPTLALLLVLVSQSVVAQQTADATAEPVTRSRLVHIEVPVAIEAGIDPILQPLEAVRGPVEDPEFSNRLESISQYNTSVEAIEAQGGVWDRRLVEELASMGLLQQQQGYHEEAIATFDRAIHINRIHSGLYTLEQIPVVEQLIQSYLSLEDWQNADIYNYYLFYVQQKAYGSDDPRLIPVLERLADWNIQAFNIGFGETRGIRLSSAQILFNAAARMVGVHFGRNDERFVGNLRKIANSAYLVSINPALMNALVDSASFRSTQDALRQQLNERSPSMPQGYASGRAALAQIVSFNAEEGDSAYDLAEAITNLGDWYLLFNRRSAAADQYQQAWDILQIQENSQQLQQQLFGQVVPLPTFIDKVEYLTTAPQIDGEDSLSVGFADLIFDVTAGGVVRNVRLLDQEIETEANSRRLGQLRRTVRNSHFRPVVVDGQRQRTDDNQFRYRYWY